MLQEAAITEPRPPRSARGREHSAKTPRMIIPRFSAAQRGAYRWGAAGVARWMVAGRPRAMSTGFDFLAADTVAHFQEHGFVKVDQFWDEEELQALRAGLTYLQSTGRLANVACEGDGVTHTEVPRNLQLCPLSPELPLFRSLPFHPKVQSAVTQLLTESADESVYCYLSQTFWKPPKHGLGTGWHQDNAYFLIDDEHAHKGCAMWTAIHDAKIENGTLRVAPGYQHQLLEHVRDGSSDHHITCDSSIKPSDELSLEVPAGGVVFFNFNTPHTTGENQTDHPR
jgi:phytanoyl-CoA hydroxylase